MSIPTRFRILAMGVTIMSACLYTAPIAQAAPAPLSDGVLFVDCDTRWIQWAEVRDRGDNRIKMTIKPTKKALIAGFLAADGMWAQYFECIGTDRWFRRLTSSQRASLRLQHDCHIKLGVLGQLKSGDTFDYESWNPNRGSLKNAVDHGCN